MTVKILAFDGSGRSNSINRKLLKIVAEQASNAGADVTLINLHDYNLPIYNGDLEAESGLPSSVIEFKKLIDENDGLLIASPEFNGGYSPLLKNAIDWATRPAPEGVPAQPFRGKIAGLIATSPGPLSGLRGIYQLNTVLFGIGVTVLSDLVAIGNYGSAFDDSGNLIDEKKQASAQKLAQRMVKLLS